MIKILRNRHETTLKTELKQRVFKIDFLHGFYMVPLSLLGLYVTRYYQEYVLYVIPALFFLYCLVDGSYRLFYNPVKKEAMKVLEREKYIANNFQSGSSRRR